MKLLNTLLFIFMFNPFVSISQTSYQPGYVVNLKGDTIQGFINYSEWENNPETIRFKSDSVGVVEIFGANQIKAFSANVGHLAKYSAYTGPITTDVTDIYNLSDERDTSVRQVTVFLKVIQEGKNILLFSYSDNQKKRFFIAPDFSKIPVELIHRIYYSHSEEIEHSKVTFEDTYKSQLYEEAKKSGTLTNRFKILVKNGDYLEYNIVRLVSIINDISSSDTSKTSSENHTFFSKFYAIGLSLAVIILLIVEFSSQKRL